MFCCTPNSLHYTSFIQQDQTQTFINEEMTLKERLKINKTQQIALPQSFCLSLQNPFGIQTDQSTISQSDYFVKVSEQTKMIEIKEIKKQNLENLWKVLKENETDQIVQDDTFGFGPYDFKVYQIGKRNEPQLQDKQYQTQMNCRICFTNQTSQKNPLMSFCECTGSIKYQHLNCLRQWIKQESNKNQFDRWSYIQYSKLTCNVCKRPWAQKVKQNKRNYYLYQSEQSEQDRRHVNANRTKICLALPTFAQEDDRQSLLVVKLYLSKTQNFLIGADDDECDLILDNINVSSIQCELTFENQKLILKDLNSYHGTAIKLKSSHQKQKQFSAYSFSSKKGILLKYNGVMMQIRSKQGIFSCLDSEQQYKISYCHYSS